jgi:DNA (cytosine-5)-methyltransferase 1
MLFPGEIVVDSFAGGGGASQGIREALGRGPHIAINHDREAIALHAANHPESYHVPENVFSRDKADPRKLCAGRPVGLMWLSPDCTHHSKAKGGKPLKKKIRGLAWVAVRWAAAVRPRVMVLENVEEFQQWGPLFPSDHPDPKLRDRPNPKYKGRTFRAFVRKLERLGYSVQWRQLRACDYGAPTIRKRLFLIARCDGQPIVWPKPTHGKGTAQPWRTAAECIDWSIPCPSIFERRKPLAANTLRRIARGLDRFVINNPRPYIVPMQHQNRPVELDEPLQTITTQNNKFQLVAPYLARTAHGEQDATGKRRGKGEHAAIEPLPTQPATNDFALVAPTLIQTGYGERDGQAPRSLDLFEPLGTVVGGGQKHALVSAFLAKHYDGNYQGPGASLAQPMPTVTAVDHNALVTSNLKRLRGTEDSHSATDAPMPTISAGGLHIAEVRAFLVAYYGNEKDGGSLFDPMRTVTSKDRMGVVTVHGAEYVIGDIGMRMLQPRELYRAQGFPESYRIEIEYNGRPLSKTAQVRMVGNSVCPPLAREIVAANMRRDQRQEAA